MPSSSTPSKKGASSASFSLSRYQVIRFTSENPAVIARFSRAVATAFFSLSRRWLPNCLLSFRNF